MPRKVFLSFLGTNEYKNCNYYYGEKCVEENCIKNVRYVQEAMVKLFCDDFSENDKIFIFLTKDAREKNWQDGEDRNKEKYQGLENRLKHIGKYSFVQTVDIPAGKSEEEIWEIFKKVYEILEEGDEIIFDITHGFRSLPMLGIVLLNYARFLKNITVKAVYYGAFEVIKDVINKPVEERNAPIFDLTGFAALQEWASAANNFVNHGITSDLKNLVSKEINPILKETKGRDETSNNLKSLFEQLDKFSQNILYNRGPNIYKAKGDTIKKALCNSMNNFITPLEPLMERIEENTGGLKNDSLQNGFVAVEWCLKYDLIPQAYTLLLENTISLIIEEINKKKCLPVSLTDKSWRESVTSAFSIIKKNIPEEDWKGDNDKIKKILALDLLKNEQFVEDMNSLIGVRNDMNHGGWRDNPSKITKLKVNAERIYKNIKELMGCE